MNESPLLILQYYDITEYGEGTFLTYQRISSINPRQIYILSCFRHPNIIRFLDEPELDDIFFGRVQDLYETWISIDNRAYNLEMKLRHFNQLLSAYNFLFKNDFILDLSDRNVIDNIYLSTHFYNKYSQLIITDLDVIHISQGKSLIVNNLNILLELFEEILGDDLTRSDLTRIQENVMSVTDFWNDRVFISRGLSYIDGEIIHQPVIIPSTASSDLTLDIINYFRENNPIFPINRLFHAIDLTYRMNYILDDDNITNNDNNIINNDNTINNVVPKRKYITDVIIWVIYQYYPENNIDIFINWTHLAFINKLKGDLFRPYIFEACHDLNQVNISYTNIIPNSNIYYNVDINSWISMLPQDNSNKFITIGEFL